MIEIRNPTAARKPVITANLAALWGALDHLGHADRFSFGESRLLEWQQTHGATRIPTSAP